MATAGEWLAHPPVSRWEGHLAGESPRVHSGCDLRNSCQRQSRLRPDSAWSFRCGWVGDVRVWCVPADGPDATMPSKERQEIDHRENDDPDCVNEMPVGGNALGCSPVT